MKTFLGIFLLVDVFFIGMVAAEAIRHAFAHFKPAKPAPKPAASITSLHLPAELKADMLAKAEADFKVVLDKSAGQLEHDLAASAERITKLLDKLGTDVVGAELERYQSELAAMRSKAEAEIGGIREQLAAHEAELKAKLAQEMEAEKQALVKQIDTKLADAVAAFLTETLQHNVDLGAQTAYIAAMLEEHKAEFKKEAVDEAPVE